MADIVSSLLNAPPALLLAATLAVVIASVLVVSMLTRTLLRPKNAPPMISCAPIFGGFAKFIKGPVGLMEEQYPKHGQVFTVPVFHKRVTFLLGPEPSPHFYKAADDKMSQKEVYEFNVPTFGRGVVFDVDHTVRAEQFRFFADSLKTAKMRTYVEMMVQEAEAYFAKGNWAAKSGEVDLLKELSDLIILTASRCLLGKEVREHLFSEVSELFHKLDLGMLPISVVFPYLPIKAHRDRDAARKELSLIFTKVIRQRKASGAQEPDMLQSFIDARYKNGDALTEDQVAGLLIAALFAGQHTSSITSTWTGMHMITDATWLGKAAAEQAAIQKECGSTLDFDVLSKMDILHLCIKETLRLHPPLILLMRMAHESFDVADKDGKQYTVPKGDIVCTSPTFSHRLPHVFPDPDAFDPNRFAPGSTQGQLPFSYIGFGGGRHGCMGETFAYLQIKTIWAVLLRRFAFEPVSPVPSPDFEAMVVGPKGETRIKYTRR